MGNLLKYFLMTASVFLLTSAMLSCEKETVSAPTIGLSVTVDGVDVEAANDAVTEEIGKRVEYLFAIRANTTIEKVRTINSVILNGTVKTVDETITMGFTGKRSDDVRGVVYVQSIGTEVAIIVTDIYGNEVRRSITVYPLNN